MALHPDTFDIGPRKGTRRVLSFFRGPANGCVRRSCAYTRSSHRRGRAANSLAFASSGRAALTAATALLAVREVAPDAPVGRPVKKQPKCALGSSIPRKHDKAASMVAYNTLV